MRTNTRVIINAFKQGKAKGNLGDSISTDGQTIYSYRTPIATQLVDPAHIRLATAKYSHTTTLQQNAIKSSWNKKDIELVEFID